MKWFLVLIGMICVVSLFFMDTLRESRQGNLSLKEGSEKNKNSEFSLHREELNQIKKKDEENKEAEDSLEYKVFYEKYKLNRKLVGDQLRDLLGKPVPEIVAEINTPLAGYVLSAKARQIYKTLEFDNLPSGVKEFLTPLKEQYDQLKKAENDILFQDAKAMRESQIGFVFKLPKNKRGRRTPSHGPTVNSVTIDNMGGWYTIHFYGDNPSRDLLLEKMTQNLTEAEQILNDFGVLLTLRKK